MTPSFGPRTFDLARLELWVPNYGTPALHSASLEALLHSSVPAWQDAGLIKPNTSFGLVVAGAHLAGDYAAAWDDPASLMSGGIALGWGKAWRKYAANALRKCRAAARESRSTLDLATNAPQLFRDVVESVGPNTAEPYLWGDFPHGGAVLLGKGKEQLLVGVSSRTPEEDHFLAMMAGEWIRHLRRISPA